MINSLTQEQVHQAGVVISELREGVLYFNSSIRTLDASLNDPFSKRNVKNINRDHSVQGVFLKERIVAGSLIEGLRTLTKGTVTLEERLFNEVCRVLSFRVL